MMTVQDLKARFYDLAKQRTAVASSLAKIDAEIKALDAQVQKAQLEETLVKEKAADDGHPAEPEGAD